MVFVRESGTPFSAAAVAVQIRKLWPLFGDVLSPFDGSADRIEETNHSRVRSRPLA